MRSPTSAFLFRRLPQGPDIHGQGQYSTVWDMFLGGSGRQRPFGDVALDAYLHLGPSHIRADTMLPGGCVAKGRSRYRARGPKVTPYATPHSRTSATGGTKLTLCYRGSAVPMSITRRAHIGHALNEASFDAIYVQFCTFLLFFSSSHWQMMLSHGESINFDNW